jgi:ATP-binding cassette subfamily F protein 3
MIQLDQVSLRRGGRVLFQKASMQIHPGWKVGLTGVNGAGKSTLFAALLGSIGPDDGTLSRPAVWTVAHMAQEVKAKHSDRSLVQSLGQTAQVRKITGYTG